MILVLDASVVVAALCSRWNRRSGRPPASRIVLRMVQLGLAESVVSAEIEAEWRRAVEYAQVRARAALADRQGFVSALARASRRVSPPPMPDAVPADPSDSVYLAAALHGGASHVVTFDAAHLLPLDGKFGLRFLTPGDLVQGLRAGRKR